jgi:hypothetical protein
MHWLAEHGKDIKRESESFKPVFPQYGEQRSGLVLLSIVVTAVHPARRAERNVTSYAQELKILK